MNIANVITAACFVCVLVLGIMVMVIQDMRGTRPAARIGKRVRETFPRSDVSVSTVPPGDLDLFKRAKSENAFHHWIERKLTRLNTVAYPHGLRIVVSAAVAAGVIAVVLPFIVPMRGTLKLLLIVGLPMQTQKFLVERYRRRFLDGFPNLIDLIVRAVRSGVPVGHVIATAAGECPEPLSSEFQIMGDSLKVGLDLAEVLEAAMRRIQIADFSFFCICLLLQRETGGQLGETLENLGAIVRTRREIRQKTAAMTGEARITTKILAAIPVVIMLSMYKVNRPYVMILFQQPAGQHLLIFSAISTILGVLIINKMAKLDTSR
jgi:tight adherence protein B